MPVDVDALLGRLHPEWCGADPPGNYLAGELKALHDDSASVFPASEHSGGAALRMRWTSTVHADFVPLEQQQEALEERKLVVPKSPRKADPVLLPKMFNKWRVPSRLTNDQRSSIGSPAEEQEEQERAVQSSRASCDRLPALPLDCRPAPATARASLHSYRPADSAHSSRAASRAVSRGDVASRAASRDDAASARAAFSCEKQKMKEQLKPKSLATRKLFQNFQRHEPERAAAARLLEAGATEQEKQLIEAALRSYRGQQSSDLQAVETWLDAASDREKEVALQFFRSEAFAGQSPEAKRKMSGVVNKLQRSAPNLSNGASSNRCYGGDAGSERQWRHLRLLTPKTRAKKWQFQTWHHMPQYQHTNAVENRTAVYTEPQKVAPRHFVVHPDLG